MCLSHVILLTASNYPPHDPELDKKFRRLYRIFSLIDPPHSEHSEQHQMCLAAFIKFWLKASPPTSCLVSRCVGISDPSSSWRRVGVEVSSRLLAQLAIWFINYFRWCTQAPGWVVVLTDFCKFLWQLSVLAKGCDTCRSGLPHFGGVTPPGVDHQHHKLQATTPSYSDQFELKTVKYPSKHKKQSKCYHRLCEWQSFHLVIKPIIKVIIVCSFIISQREQVT